MILYVEQPFAYDLADQRLELTQRRHIESRSSWTKALTTGSSSSWAIRLVGRASH